VDTTALRDAYRALLDAADTVTAPGAAERVPPSGEWDAEQILAHVVIVNAVTLNAVCAVSSGVNTTYDNRTAADAWTLGRVIARAGGAAGLRERIRVQGEALCALAGGVLAEAEGDTPVPTLLLSNGVVLVDQPVPLRDLVAGLADAELPGHTAQLLALPLRDAALSGG
jgi:hypothetical protein